MQRNQRHESWLQWQFMQNAHNLKYQIQKALDLPHEVAAQILFLIKSTIFSVSPWTLSKIR